MDLRPRIELRQDISLHNQIGIEQLPPEYKTAELRAALDLMSRLSKYDLLTLGAEHKDLGREMLESKIIFNESQDCYYLSKNVLLNHFNYNHLQYAASSVANKCISIKFSTQFQKKDLESLVEGPVQLRKTPRRTYVIANDGTKLIEARGAMLKLLAKPGSRHYDLALDSIADLTTKIHEEKLLMVVPTISMNQYLLGFFLRIPDYLSLQNYVRDALNNFSLCLDKKVQTLVVDGSNVSAEQFCKATAKNSTCYTVDKKFIKRHIQYFYADETGSISVKFNPDLDCAHISRSIMKPVQVSIDSGAWVNLEELDYEKVELRKAEGRVKIRTLPGTKLLRNTKFASADLEYVGGKPNNAIRRKGAEQPLVLLRNQSITIPPGLDYVDRELAFEIANTVYAQLLFQTPFVERKNKKSALRSDERELIKEISKKSKQYVERVGGTSYDYAAILVQRDMLRETRDALKKIPEESPAEKIPLLEAVKKYKASLVDALRATKQGVIKADDAGNVYVQDFEKFMEDRK